MPKSCCNNVVLRDRCDIQQDSREPGDHHPNYTGPAFARNVPCDVDTVSGIESFRGRQLEATTTHLVTMRYRANVAATMRLVMKNGIYKDQIFNVMAVRPVRKVGAPPMLELSCRERTAT